MYFASINGSLTATTSISSLNVAIRNTNLPIRPKPARLEYLRHAFTVVSVTTVCVHKINLINFYKGHKIKRHQKRIAANIYNSGTLKNTITKQNKETYHLYQPLSSHQSVTLSKRQTNSSISTTCPLDHQITRFKVRNVRNLTWNCWRHLSSNCSDGLNTAGTTFSAG